MWTIQPGCCSYSWEIKSRSPGQCSCATLLSHVCHWGLVLVAHWQVEELLPWKHVTLDQQWCLLAMHLNSLGNLRLFLLFCCCLKSDYARRSIKLNCAWHNSNGVRRPRQIRGPKIQANVPPKGPCWRHRVCHLGAIVVAWAARWRLGVGRV